ncbi:TPA: hypothetical protein R5155_000354 [Campylobacter coli]|nr:hypothetical protein [Campylobacter coli]
MKHYEELKAKDIDIDIVIPKLVFLCPNQTKKRTICGVINKYGSESKILDEKHFLIVWIGEYRVWECIRQY